MIDTKGLGKIKYIYRIYESNDYKLHIEKYPVIYINSNVVYFKTGRKQEYLEHCELSRVYTDFMSLGKEELYRRGYYERRPRYWFNNYFLNVEDNIDEIYADLLRQYNAKQDPYRKNEAKERLLRTKAAYMAALKEYERVFGKEEEK